MTKAMKETLRIDGKVHRPQISFRIIKTAVLVLEEPVSYGSPMEMH